ncbi:MULTISPECIES: lytic murein transglycosylase [Asticcacaulis]|uniref:lytic murein transglycosylase n=1 Tax=Asticcacaulis TaxID=76890 RepID=UPI001AE79653|nr:MULTISPECIES: lytic murein transglycosylase [Asticcacaulis]MBP2158572.1 lytic murein transglycosylase [Asticcacaulis solisilvae]MDR6799618.1 lytic murein transglycosylase [Asticcacaulis sp. BE141]
MRFRALSLFAVLTACASTGPQTPTPSTAPTASTPVPQQHPEISAPTANAPAATPASPATNPVPITAYGDFDAWKQDFIKKAVMRGFDAGFVTAALDGVQPLQSVKSADNQQPEFSKPASSYMRQAVSPARAAAARARVEANTNVPAIEAKYGVPKCLLGGIWSMESDLGRVQGSTDVLAALATLAFDGRRRVWAEDQLIAALTILRDHKIPRERLKGSWAGAMGQTQFMPDSYLRLGADGDGDGIVDIWASDSDALASSANLLAKEGWKAGQEWAVEVILPPGFDYYLAETEKTKKPADWQALGVKRADGGYFRPEELNENGIILLPSGANGPAFMALPNHYVIRKYNNSTSYALAVGLLADGVCGKDSTVTPWPVEPPLSLDQRMKTQEALKAAGFNPGTIDGVIGVGTRQAIREWQKANNEPADGYLSFDLANRFVVMQGGTPAVRPS